MMSILHKICMVAAAIALLTTAVSAQITPDYLTSSYVVDVTDAPAQAPGSGWVNITAGDDRIDYIPLGFNFVFWNRTYNSINVSANGNLQFRTAVTTSVSALFGQTSAALNPCIAFFYTDLVPTNANSRSYMLSGTAPNRQFTVRFTNVPLYPIVVNETALNGEVILQEGTNTITTRYYSIPIKWTTSSTVKTVEIGIQAMANYVGPYQPPIEYVAMWNDHNFTVEAAAVLTGKQIVYTPLNSVPVGPDLPITCQANPIDNTASYDLTVLAAPAFAEIPELNNMTSTDDRIDYTPLGFSFTYFGRVFTSMNISSNGNAQFVTGVTGSANAFFGSTVVSYNPAIAYFHADMKPTDPTQRTWALTGTAPNRKFTLRYNDVPYCCTASPGNGVVLDLVLSETTNVIDMIYYRVPIGTKNMEIGLQGIVASDWISYWNDAAFPAQCISALQGKQLRFTPQTNDVVASTGTSARSSSSSTGASNARSSSSSVAVPSQASSSTPSSTASQASSSSTPVVIPVVSSSAAHVVESSSSAAGQQPPINNDDGLNGAASINVMIAFVIVAISMIVAM